MTDQNARAIRWARQHTIISFSKPRAAFAGSPGTTRASRASNCRQKAEATERMLLRRTPGAKPGAPRPEVAEAVAAAKRYFEGRGDGFFRFQARPRRAGLAPRAHLRGRLDGSDGAAQRPTVPWRRNSGPDRKPRVMLARPWRGIR